MEINLLYLLPVIAIVVFLYRRLSKNKDYFHEKPIPSLATSVLFGSTGALMLKKCTFSDFVKQAYDKYAGVKLFGLVDGTRPIFVLRDPELIKRVGVKDFDFFVNRRPFPSDDAATNENVVFSRTLVGMRDQKWRDMRATLSPAFTGSKMRAMFDLMLEYSDRLMPLLREEAAKEGYVDHEMKDLFARIGNDIIATCAFGLQVESVKNRDNEFYTMGKNMLNFGRIIIFIRIMAYRLAPTLMNKLKVDIFDKQPVEYFSQIIRDAVRTREAHGIVRPDVINLLLQAQRGALKHHQEAPGDGDGFATVEESDVGKTSVNKSISEPEFIAQCLIFFFAGFDSVSTAFTFMSYELTCNPDVQQRLYEEVLETEKTLEGKPLTYDALQQMKYMDMVVSESLRMWPVPAMDRLCARDYVMDAGNGLQVTIDKGSCVWFPIHGIHRDPKYYPNPTKFDPERFSEANRVNINVDAYLPFGIGPRNCIGSRFALMEIKAIMYHMLKNFSFERNEKTNVPVKLARGFTGLGVEGGMHLRLKRRE